eukprot:COSAG01_NODE_9449_length_2444_cov_2.666098_1_plen_148_part_10
MVGGKAVRVHCGYFHDEATAGRAAAAEAARQGVKALREEARQRAEETRRRGRKERAELGFRCAADDHGKGLSTRILEFHRGTRHTISTYRPSKTGTRDPQWKQLTHWRFPRPQKVRDNFSYDARAIRDSILRRIVSLRAREPTGVLRG